MNLASVAQWSRVRAKGSNARTVLNRSRKVPAPALFVLSIACLFVLFPLSGDAQVVAPSAKSSIQRMADDLANQLSARKLKVVVLDFSPPNVRSAPFGAYLAD